jgi:hypothetical protein
MFGKRDMPQDPKQPEQESKVDITKRYDVYCTRYPQGMHVYRNVLFKGTRTLFGTGQFDVMSQFLELEHPNGEQVFISVMALRVSVSTANSSVPT